jgi:hypothetical protein
MHETEMIARNESGKFVQSPDSLHPKTIGLRLRKSHYQKWVDSVEASSLSSTELARAIIEAWLNGTLYVEDSSDA